MQLILYNSLPDGLQYDGSPACSASGDSYKLKFITISNGTNAYMSISKVSNGTRDQPKSGHSYSFDSTGYEVAH